MGLIAIKGLILEVTLEYPKELHDLHNEYPLAPERIRVQKEMLSDYCRQIAERGARLADWTG